MRALVLLSPVVMALSLTACGDETTIESGAPDAGTGSGDSDTPRGPELGGVDLAGQVSLTGTEPFWGVRMDGAELIYSGVDRPEQRAPRPEPVLMGTVATWTTETAQGAPLTVTLMETECSDGMSDRTYPLTARVEIAGEVLNGCAASTAWMMSTGEDGQPREG